MKALVSREKPDGTFHEYGMNDQTIISGLKTFAGIRKRARAWAKGSYRIQYFNDNGFYGEPFKVETHQV